MSSLTIKVLKIYLLEDHSLCLFRLIINNANLVWKMAFTNDSSEIPSISYRISLMLGVVRVLRFAEHFSLKLFY